MIEIIFITYVLLVNLAGFVIMGLDKRYARDRKRRVPEKRLFALCAIGGSLGVLLGMRTWRHKTKHRSFTTGVPLLLALNAALIVLIARQVG